MRIRIPSMIVAAFLASPAQAAEPGQVCVLKKKVRVSAKPKDKGQKTKLKQGQRFVIVGSEPDWLAISIDGEQAFIFAALPDKICTLEAARPDDDPMQPAGADPDGALAGGEDAGGTQPDVEGFAAPSPGTLKVTVSEDGAAIKVDGTVIGISPMPPAAVPGGVHSLSVEKGGFVVARREVEVTAGAVSAIDVELIPSAELARRYKEEAALTRAFSWAALGGAVGFLGGSAGLLVGASTSSAALNDDIRAYNAAPVGDPAVREDLHQRQRSIALMDGFMVGLAVAAAAAFATWAVLYFTGEDPERFDAYLTAEVETAGTGMTVAPAGAGLAVRF